MDYSSRARDKRRRSNSPSDISSTKSSRTSAPSKAAKSPLYNQANLDSMHSQRASSKEQSRLGGQDVMPISSLIRTEPRASENPMYYAIQETAGETLRNLVEEILLTLTASLRSELAHQKAKDARKDFVSLHRKFDSFPMVTDQHRKRMERAEAEAARTKSDLQPLMISLLTRFTQLFNTVSKTGATDFPRDDAKYVPSAKYEELLKKLQESERHAEDAKKTAAEAMRQSTEAAHRCGKLESRLEEMLQTASKQGSQSKQEDTAQLQALHEKLSDHIVLTSLWTDRTARCQEECRSYKARLEHTDTRLEALDNANKEMFANMQKHNLSLAIERSRISKLAVDAASFEEISNGASKSIQELQRKSDDIHKRALVDLERGYAMVNQLKDNVQMLHRDRLADQTTSNKLSNDLHQLQERLEKVTIPTLDKDLRALVDKELQIVHEDARAKEEILAGCCGELVDKIEAHEAKLAEVHQYIEDIQGFLDKVQTRQPAIEARHVPVVPATVDLAPATIPSTSNTDKDREIDRERLDVLAHATNDLERRFNNLQTNEMADRMIHYLLPRVKELCPEAATLQRAMRDVQKLHVSVIEQSKKQSATHASHISDLNLRVGFLERKLAQVMEYKEERYEKLGDDLDVLRDKLQAMRNEWSEDTRYEHLESQLSKTKYREDRIGHDISVLFQDTLPRIDQAIRKTEKWCTNQDSAIGQTQAEIDQLARLVGVAANERPQWDLGKSMA